MKKEDIVRIVSEEVDLPQGKTNEVLTAAITCIASALEQGETLFLRRFGTFETVTDHWRSVQDPNTRIRTHIQKQKIKFTPSSAIRAALDSRTIRSVDKPACDREEEYN